MRNNNKKRYRVAVLWGDGCFGGGDGYGTAFVQVLKEDLPEELVFDLSRG